MCDYSAVTSGDCSGGGFQVGASNYNQPDALVVASNSSAVVVTINYRLHAFGFLGGAALRPRSADGSMGNYGIKDQQQALKWVRKHIGAFQGNNRLVTVFGESAGEIMLGAAYICDGCVQGARVSLRISHSRLRSGFMIER